MENEKELPTIEEKNIDIPLIADDRLIQIAAQAEKRIAAVNKIKQIALRVTNYRDWTDQGGKPYLQVSGSEKVARVFGISWRFNGDIRREDEPDGHFTYIVPMEFIMGNSSIQFEGSRSSKDPFFSKKSKYENGEKKSIEVPPSEIDRTDVQKGAITNAIGNGITRLLGIRNLTWEDLEAVGIKKAQISKVDYKKTQTTENKPDSKENKPDSKPENTNLISEPQVKRLYAILNGSGKSEEQLMQFLGTTGITSIKEINKSDYNNICDWIQKA